ncbi:hypothetical protein RBB50_003578 [Rhinocladiella similis]
MPSDQLTIPALSRPSFLGQLYNSSTGNLLNDDLFPTSAVVLAAPKDAAGLKDVHFLEARESKDRADLLGVDASVSVSLMGGTMDLKGSGSFLDRSDSVEESLSITGIISTTTVHQRLDIDKVQSAVIMTPEKVLRTGATHVVTAITYGASLVGTLTETNTRTNSTMKTEGHFSLDLAKNFGFLAGASGGADLNVENYRKITDYNLQISLLGDYLDLDPEKKVPITPVELVRKIQAGSSLFTNSVPVQLLLTPLKAFNKVSTELMYSELSETALRGLMDLYDKFKTLSQQWASFLLQVQEPIGDLLPSFRDTCRQGTEAVDLDLSQYRKDLGSLIVSWRNGTLQRRDEVIGNMLQSTREKLNLSKKNYESISQSWSIILQWKDSADNNNFPFTTVSELAELMESSSRQAVALVLVPKDTGNIAVRDIYRELYENMLDLFKELVEKPPPGALVPPAIVCHSIYADDLVLTALLGLDGQNRALESALNLAQATKKPAFLVFGLTSDVLGLPEWKTSGQEGWGVVEQAEAGTRYIGELKGGLYHGLGVIRYADKSSYRGRWFQGRRDGQGTYSSGSTRETGVFVDNFRHKDGRVIQVSVYHENVMVDTATMAVICAPAGFHPRPGSEADVELLKTLMRAHIKKMAAGFGWAPDQQHWITTVWEAKVPHIWLDVNGEQAEEQLWTEFRSEFKIIARGGEVQEFGDFSLLTWDGIGRNVQGNPWLDGNALYREPNRDWEYKDVKEFGTPVHVRADFVREGDLGPRYWDW